VFIESLRQATRGDFQNISDGLSPYRSAITTTLSDRADCAMLIRVYEASVEGEAHLAPPKLPVRRRSQSWDVLIQSASARRLVGRQNLSARVGTRRFTRLTNAFSKKFKNH
jgi:hypothetical protein